jgi:hypothetical protein
VSIFVLIESLWPASVAPRNPEPTAYFYCRDETPTFNC